MEPLPEEMLRFYAAEYDEAARLGDDVNQLELARVRQIVRRHLPAGQRVLDVGGGPGVHAAWLAEDGHDVHLVDPVERHVTQARDRGLSAAVGDARRLPDTDASVDAVLLFGPLYHLTERADRVLALTEARRVTRPGGLVFVAAISRFASLFDGLVRGFLLDGDRAADDMVRRDLADGQHRNPDGVARRFTTAYFHRPDELAGELADAGLAIREIVGVEGLAGWLPDLMATRWADPLARERIVWAAAAIEAEPSLRGLSPHLLGVAEVP